MSTPFAFAETLPENCPPSTASQPDGLVVFRLVESTSPTEIDFASHALRWPAKFGKHCRAYAVSVFTCQKSLGRLLEMPVHSQKQIARLTLTRSSGVIKQTGDDETHHSWWRAQAFDAVAACEVLP